MTTKIEYCEETWNPITGCTKISPGCKNCYAERMAKRLAGRFGYPRDEPFRPGTVHPDKYDEPLRWKKPRMIFVVSMGDLFHEDVQEDAIWDVLSTVALCPQHQFLMLTKRPDRMAEMFGDEHNAREWIGHGAMLMAEDLDDSQLARRAADILHGGFSPHHKNIWPLPNLWLGVTAEDQPHLEKRGRILMQIPAAKRFVSYEPGLGPLDISPDGAPYFYYNDATHGEPVWRGPDWFICGGETGRGARPMHPDWARGVRDQCVQAGVPFFFKQWGEWIPESQMSGVWPETRSGVAYDPNKHTREIHIWEDGSRSVRCGRVFKERAGRLLDGKVWDQLPGAIK